MGEEETILIGRGDLSSTCGLKRLFPASIGNEEEHVKKDFSRLAEEEELEEEEEEFFTLQ